MDGESIARQAGVDPRDLESPESRSPVSANVQFWKAAAEAAGDPCFGLVAAAYVQPSATHVLTYAVLASDSIKDGLQRICRFSQVLTTGLRAEIEDRGDRYRFRWLTPAGVGNIDIPLDAAIAYILRVVRFLAGERLVPLAINLRRTQPPCAARYLEILGVAPTFSAENCEIDFAKDVAEKPLPFGNKDVARASDVIVESYLARLDRDAFAFRVRQAIIERLPSGDAQEVLIARLLGLSTRVLQRRLSGENTSFQALLEESREALARSYLEEGRWSVSEIGYRLGFSEVSAFSRAFKRWTGEAPRDYAAERR